MRTIYDTILWPQEWTKTGDKRLVRMLKGRVFFTSEVEFSEEDKLDILNLIDTRTLVDYLNNERGREVYEKNVTTEQQMHILRDIATEEVSPNNIYNAETLKQALADFVDKNAHKIRFY